MIYFLPDGDDRIKIGWSSSPQGVLKRFRAHRGSNTRVEFYCAIEGDKHHESAIHEHFCKSRVNVDGNQETFYLTDDIRDYVEWLGEQAWAACSLEEVCNPFAHTSVDIMWPNQDYRRARPSVRVDQLFTPMVGPLRAPLTPEERGSLAIQDTNEWYTPSRYVESARFVMGSIDLDPASNHVANQTIKADHYYTKSTDGLAPHNPWFGNVWCNPPYGGTQAQFAARAIEEYATGTISQAVLCLNAHTMTNHWFDPLLDHPYCLLRGRVRFIGGASPLGPKTEENNSPMNGTVFVYLGPHKARFRDEFESKYGRVFWHGFTSMLKDDAA